MDRLNTEQYHTREITYIRRSKKKAPGFTKINKQILEKCTDKSLEQLKNIFNACWSAGFFFPNTYKEAIIKFIPKKDKALTNPINYRSISLLEVPGKIFERIIQARLNTFLSENKILKER